MARSSTSKARSTRANPTTTASAGKGTGKAAAPAPEQKPVAAAVQAAVTVPDAGTGAQVAAVTLPVGEDGKPAAVEPKCSGTRLQRGRPHPSLLQVIEWKGNHPGKALRIRRWHRYTVGMSVLHCRVTEGLDHLDVGFYVAHGLMKLRAMTEEERKVALARWEGEEAPAQPAAAPAQETGTEATQGTASAS